MVFFSEHGLDGQLRDLAQQLGITHTLLYHYFPTKSALIERVYSEMFAGRWKREWEKLLDQKGLDAETKFTRFYCEYARMVQEPTWVRIFMFSGLSDRYITDRYFSMLRETLFPRLIRESRKHRGASPRGKPTGREMELLLGLHGSIFYMGIRRWIYGQNLQQTCPQSIASEVPDEQYIHDRVLAYLHSAGEVLARPALVKPAIKPVDKPSAKPPINPSIKPSIQPPVKTVVPHSRSHITRSLAP